MLELQGIIAPEERKPSSPTIMEKVSSVHITRSSHFVHVNQKGSKRMYTLYSQVCDAYGRVFLLFWIKQCTSLLGIALLFQPCLVIQTKLWDIHFWNQQCFQEFLASVSHRLHQGIPGPPPLKKTHSLAGQCYNQID